MFLLYFLVSLLASTIGAIAGIGGGIIIKPVLDLLGDFPLQTIEILSAMTVLAMTTVPLIKLQRNGITFEKCTSLLLASSSIGGGVLGKMAFTTLVTTWNRPAVAELIQMSAIALLLVTIYGYFKLKHLLSTFIMTNKWGISSVGVGLGFLSSFLEIGGGPLNIAVLSLLFSLSNRYASANSLLIIFFSQLASLSVVAFTTGFTPYNLSLLPFMVGGISGGWIGATIVLLLANERIELIFHLTLIAIFAIDLYNITTVL